MEDYKNDIFEKKIKPILLYVGTIGAIAMSVAYIICVFVMIFGFHVEKVLNTTIFAIVNAFVGFIIMQFLKVQGTSFAKEIPEVKRITTIYYATKTKNKKVHSIKYFWTTSVAKDIFTKVLTIGVTTFGLIYFLIEGSKDYMLILLAVVNLIMFACFGLLSLVKAYDFYRQEHLKFMKDKLAEVGVDTSEEKPKDANVVIHSDICSE